METVSTLRFGKRAKRIVNRAVQNLQRRCGGEGLSHPPSLLSCDPPPLLSSPPSSHGSPEEVLRHATRLEALLAVFIGHGRELLRLHEAGALQQQQQAPHDGAGHTPHHHPVAALVAGTTASVAEAMTLLTGKDGAHNAELIAAAIQAASLQARMGGQDGNDATPSEGGTEVC